MAAEVEYLGRVLENPSRPFVAILGGAKVSDKLEVIQNLLPRVDALLIGGAMAYTFLKARGCPGRHVARRGGARSMRRVTSKRRRAREICAWSCRSTTSSHRRSRPARRPRCSMSPIRRIGDRKGLDIGPKTIERYRQVLRTAQTVTLERPDGRVRDRRFATGTIEIAKAVAEVKGTTVIGGGDSIAAVAKAGVTDRITHISTGGGASLEFLGGRKLPGVEALARST